MRHYELFFSVQTEDNKKLKAVQTSRIGNMYAHKNRRHDRCHVIKDSLIKHLIINQILNTGVFPSQLNIAKVIPIFKKDDNKIFNNYRPISLLPVLSKVVEKVICSQINNFFITNNLFYDSQYGFRP